VLAGRLGGAFQMTTMPNVSTAMLDADYWISKMNHPDKIIMNQQQIQSFNQQIRQCLPGLVYRLADYPQSLTREQLTTLVDQTIPDYPCYLGNKTLNNAYWQELRRQMNISGIKGSNEVRYAFTVRRSNLRVYPTADVIGDEPGDRVMIWFRPVPFWPRNRWLFCIECRPGMVFCTDVQLYGLGKDRGSGPVRPRDLAGLPES
jgi:hypothetical protein